MQKITPCLWYDKQAEEAAKYYCSIFKNSKIVETQHLDNAGPDGKSRVTVVYFQLDGVDFMGLDGGPEFKFNEAISMSVECKDQAEVDYYWSKLTDGGSEVACGWLRDKFGMSWQIVPKGLREALVHPDKVKAKKAMQAMMQMVKLDISKIHEAMEK